MGIRVKQNKSETRMILRFIEDGVKESIDEELKDVAEFIISVSPVDTGAYMTSHSYGPKGSSGKRSRTSRRKPRNQSWTQKAGEARSQLYSDIESVDSLKSGGGVFGNRAPHSGYVEERYAVYSKAKASIG